MANPYWLLETDCSHCPECNGFLHLLAEDSLQSPAFYLCFGCKFVAQVGVGKVLNGESAPVTIEETNLSEAAMGGQSTEYSVVD